MASVYLQAVEAARNGKKVKVNLVDKSLKIGKEYLIDDGVYNGTDNFGVLVPDQWLMLKELYDDYKRSVPHESDNNRKSYFYAVPVKELTLADMVDGEDRYVAQVRLETYVLLAGLQGLLDFQGWFYQDPEDKEFVILKSWIK